MIKGRGKPFERPTLGASELGIVDGRVPPHDLDAEAAVLSASMLAGRSALTDVNDILKPTHFYSEAHLRIFETVVELDAENAAIDVVQVASRLKDKQRLAQVGGMPYLGQILDASPVITHIRAHAQKVVELWQLRQMILLCHTFAARGYGDRGPIPGFMNELEGEVFKLARGTAQDRAIGMRPLLVKVYADVADAYEKGRPSGIATGFGSFDDKTAGFHRKEVTLIAARPGMGKTSLMVSMALNVAGADRLLIADDGGEWKDQGVLFCSLEMPREQIGLRAIAVDSLVSAQRLRTGRLSQTDWQPMTMSCNRMSSMPIDVDDTPAINLSQLRTQIRRCKSRMDQRGARLAVVMLDYLQLMKGEKGDGRREEIGEISRGLKQVAKDEDIALVAGCQLNRAVESRTGVDKRPRISDLRESGDLEQDADNVVFIHRPAAYGEKDPEGEEGRSELIIAKQRNGPTGTAVVRYVAGSTRFEQMPGY